MLIKYEMHFKTDKNLTELMEGIRAGGYKVEAKLHKKYLKMFIMEKSRDIFIEFDLSCKDHEDGFYIYEIGTAKYEDFTKIREMLSSK